MAAADFDGKLARADLVITGEGRIDEQTAFGKTALGVAQRAAEAGVACIAVGGGVTPEGIAALAPLGAVVVPVSERPQTVEEAMAAGAAPGRAVRRADRPARSAWRRRRERRRRRRRRPKPRAEAAPEEAPVLRPGPELREAPRALPAGPRRLRARRARRALRPAGVGAPPRPDVGADPHDPDPEQRRHERRARVRGAPPRLPEHAPAGAAPPRQRLGRRSACPDGVAARLGGRRVRPDRRADRTSSGPAASPTRRRPGSRPPLRTIREERGDYSLEFLADMSAARGARRG